MKLFAVFDRKAQTYTHLIPAMNEAVLIRDLGEVVRNDQQNNWHKWPADYALYEVGEWSQLNGFVDQRTDPEDPAGVQKQNRHVIDFNSLATPAS